MSKLSEYNEAIEIEAEGKFRKMLWEYTTFGSDTDFIKSLEVVREALNNPEITKETKRMIVWMNYDELKKAVKALEKEFNK